MADVRKIIDKDRWLYCDPPFRETACMVATDESYQIPPGTGWGKRGVGYEFLAYGKQMSMYIWHCDETFGIQEMATGLELLGYVLIGEAEVTMGGETTLIRPGDSWLVSARCAPVYDIRQRFSAVMVRSPSIQRDIEHWSTPQLC